MEYIHTVLFQIPASRLEEASAAGGLLSDIDEHRRYLREQPGFRDMRVTRSINTEGNVLVVVETRWTDDGSLVRYETSDTNIASIVRKHDSILVRDSLQVLDMEALRTETAISAEERSQQARERVMLPLLIPIGVLAFALLIIYGLSRIYLELPGESPVALAAGITFGILILAFYFARNPQAPAWQIGGVLVAASLLLLGGTIWAIAVEDEGEAHGEPTPAASPGESPEPGPGPGEMVITMGDDFFVFEGEREPTITIPAGQEVTFTLTNEGAAIHNMHVNGTDNTYEEDICTVGGPSTACSDPNTVRAGATATITINISEPGTYNFRCDFHPIEMVGLIQVE